MKDFDIEPQSWAFKEHKACTSLLLGPVKEKHLTLLCSLSRHLLSLRL